ncbi:MAG TPA: DNA replication/repair protein RecF [Dongiaceae bacterium]|jgi:DNA replication and repair protein RecF|nr:DNA replication/repair protein RecF [Dongiaceae bacterium]
MAIASIAASQSAPRVETGLCSLALQQFRNFWDQSVETALSPLVITGPNGAGKSNLLEAVSYFGPGSGLFQARLSEVQRAVRGNRPDMQPWTVFARYRGGSGEHALGTGRDPNGIGTERERRVNRIDGTPLRSQADFAELLSYQCVTAKTARLFADQPATRRRFLDRIAGGIDPAHIARVSDCEQALSERNRVLERADFLGEETRAWLDGIEGEIASLSVAIAAHRAETIAALNAHREDFGGSFPRADLFLRGTVDAMLESQPALAVEDWLRSKLQDSRAQDKISGTTPHGAHRSDLGAHYRGRRHGEVPLEAQDCSSGEQKALVISIVLSAASLIRHRRGESPLLLLDDIMAGLDEKRRLALAEAVASLGCQAWVTGLEEDEFRGFRGWAQFYAVTDGRITTKG